MHVLVLRGLGGSNAPRLPGCTAAKVSPEAPQKQQNALEVFNVVDRGSSACIETQASAQFDAEQALLSMAAVLQQHGVPRCVSYDRDPRLVGTR